MLQRIAAGDPAALTVLIQALRNPDEPLGRPAATALLGFGAAALPALTAALADANTEVRGGALHVLARLGPAAESATPDLLKTLQDEEADVRWAAARALGAIGRQVEAVAPALAAVLTDESPTVRGWASLALSAFGAAAVPFLVPVLGHKLPRARAAAAEALGLIGPPAVAAVAVLGRDSRTRKPTCVFGPTGRRRDRRPGGRPGGAAAGPARRRLRRLPRVGGAAAGRAGRSGRAAAAADVDPRQAARALGAADALGQVGERAAAAVPLLITCLADADEAVQERVARALGEIGPQSVPPLVEALRRPELGVRIGAVDALARIGPAAGAASRPLLDLLLTEEHRGLCRFAAEALGRIGEAGVGTLTDAFASAGPESRAKLAVALGVVGPAARTAVAALQKALRDEDPLVRRDALWALGRIAPPEDAAPSLASDVISALNDPDRGVAEQAALSLGTLGGRARSALPVVLDGLRSPDADRRRIAALALGEVLTGRAKDPDAAEVRRTALAALSAVARQDVSAAVRGQALRALGALDGDAATEDVPASLRALEDPDAAVQARAVEVLAGMGSKAEPLLRAALLKPNALVRRAALSALVRMRPAEIVPLLTTHLKDRDWETARIAAEGLAGLGEGAGPAVSALAEALSSPLNVVREAAFKALTPLDPKCEYVLPALLNALKTPSRPAQAWAAEQLGKFQERAAAAVPLLFPLMKGRQRGGVRAKAVAALKEVGAAAVPGVIAAITQPDKKAREQAFDSLASINWQAYNALRPYREQLGSPPPDVRTKMADALAALGAPAAGQLQNLLTKLRDRGAWRTRQDAAIALGKLGAKAAAAVPDLIVALKDSDNDVREKSAEALGLIGKEAASAVPGLLEKLNDPNEKVRQAAALALGRVGHEAKTPLDMLLTMIKLENQTPAAMRMTVQLLSRHGRDALPALPQLTPLLRHENAGVRVMTAFAVGQIGPEAGAAAPELRRALDDPYPAVQVWAAGAYARVTKETEPPLPTLARLLPCREPQMRTDLAYAVQYVGAPALSLLRESLRHSDVRYRLGAAEVLGRMGAAARPALADLETALKDPDSQVRQAAESAVKQLGPKPAAAT